MLITKSQLKKVIKEELIRAAVLQEIKQYQDVHGRIDEATARELAAKAVAAVQKRIPGIPKDVAYAAAWAALSVAVMAGQPLGLGDPDASWRASSGSETTQQAQQIKDTSSKPER